MGCDIHIGLEKKVGDKWVMVNRLDGDAAQRNYRRFAALAGVRGKGQKAKGIPEDVSDSMKLFIDDWCLDGHSHSYMSLKDAAIIFIQTLYNQDEFAKEYPFSYFFNISECDVENCRIVFFFDN